MMPDLRIINGLSAPETRYPYAASLQYNDQHFCGGSLVSPNVVITAAHCTSTPTKITLGRYDLDSPSDYDYEVMDVVEKIIHPYYDKAVVENDLALLVLERDSVHPYVGINGDVAVPSGGDRLAVMGWGDVDPSEYGQKTSDELRETDVWYMPNGECEESEGYVKTNEGVLFGSYEGSITSSMMCALDNIGTTSDACQGDSGGALVKPGSDNNADVLVGLVSWGFGCADPNFPGVYSRLSAYFDDFLRPTICQYSRTPPPYLNCNPGSGVGWSPASTPAPVSTPDGLLTIFVDTDPISPEDLGWELASVPDGRIIARRPVGHYSGVYGMSTSEEVVVEPEKFYRLTIFDDMEDGFRGEMAIVSGRRYVKSDALVSEPGFSKVSGRSVVHGFYVGDNPPRVLTLDLTFDSNPPDLAWSITNVEDDLPLGFKWFDWYGKSFMKATETIPIYGNERGVQEYIFTVLDLNGDGMCCSEGQGSFSLYLGDPSVGYLIATGGVFTTDQSFTFEIGPAGLGYSPEATNPNPTALIPTEYPTPSTSLADTSVQSEFYMTSSTGICQVSDGSKPSWILQVFEDYDECCQFSWNKQQCIAAKPIEVYEAPPTYEPTTPPSVHILEDHNNSEYNTVTFTPATGSFTCKTAGMTCTITCTECGSIKRVASGMAIVIPNESTIVYTAERGTDYHPDDPSRLVLVESGSTASSVISCDEGCECASVSDDTLGCGLIAKPIGAQPVAPPSSQPLEKRNGSVRLDPYSIIIPCGLLFWSMLR